MCGLYDKPEDAQRAAGRQVLLDQRGQALHLVIVDGVGRSW